ncbi:cobalt-zinc-cadmium efflux system membrane fusion protein [Lutibacter oceani]|uniref:Cobalt-zinc-cadmium efflux system membrane fusion protein n=1 Tax=Lutibacter oceani TaxID=1853311 RepID=A0A3D9RKA0_9FLAO|nr:efflux RND transporter periplasmic adaptor subunit [Lutibacter oceani]REE80303.1 cobalt-zinc-cadmium efflux system membrane fusion protein [Lutibacter oceani]
MKNILKTSTILLLLIIVLGSCQDKTTQQNEEHNEEGGEQEETSNIVALQLKQLEVMNIELGTTKQVNLGSSLKVNGQLELPPQNMASVSAIVGGRVQSIAVIEGNYVKKGQVLAQLNNPEFITMQREYLSAKSNISFLEQDYQRKKALLKDGITSAKSFQQAEAAYNEGKSALNAAKSTLQLMGINISALENGKITTTVPVVSPIKGSVQNIQINIGKFVGPEQEMFEIVDNEYLYLGLKVFEKDVDNAKVGQKIAFTLTTRPDKIYEAEIFALGKAFDMDTRAVKVHAKIIGTHDGLLMGMFVEARITTSSKVVNALPNEAFVSEKGLDYVFVQKNKTDNKIEFEKIKVNKGISDLGFSEVLFIEKIPENTIIVLKGAYYLNSEMQKSEFGDDD